MLAAVGANLILLGFAIAEYFDTRPGNIKKTAFLSIIPILSGVGMIIAQGILKL